MNWRMYQIMFFVLTSMAVSAQEIAGFNITQNQGLPSNTIYDIFQDNTGYLWVATENGLARYNGIHFRTYSNRSIRSRAVGGLVQSNDGTLWLHNFLGEILFVKSDTLRQMESWEKRYTDGFPNVAIDGEQLLISSSNHLYQYTISDQSWRTLDSLFKGKNETNTITYHLVKDKQALVVHSNSDTTFIKNINAPEQYVLPHNLYPYNINVLRLETWKNTFLAFNPKNHKLFWLSNEQVSDSSPVFDHILPTTSAVKNLGDSLLAFLTTDGAHIVDQKNHWRKLLPGMNVSCIATDREGGIWIGTLTQGLFYFPTTESRIFSKEKYPLFTKLAYDSVQQQIWVGGLDGKIKIFSAQGMELGDVKTPTSKEVQSMLIDPLNNCLLVYTDRLYWYDLTSKKPLRTISIAAVKKMIRIGEEYALATSGGLFMIHHRNNTVSKRVMSQRITSMGYDEQRQRLWIGSQKGLFVYALDDGSLTPWNEAQHDFSLGVSAVEVFEDDVLLATLTNGLWIIKENKPAKHLTIDDGLPSDHITSMVVKDNCAWISTDAGVAIVNLKTFEISIIDESKGMMAKEIYDLSVVKNKLWVCHPLGLQFFESIPSKNPQQPTINVIAASTQDKSIDNFQNGIKLFPPSQQLTLQFDISNNLRSQGRASIHYRIKEIDDGRWYSTTIKTPQANYLSLPFGNFTFEAYAKNEDGIRSGKVISIPLEVVAPFWKRTWFMLFMFLLALLVMAIIFYFQFKAISDRQKAKLLHQTQEQELRIAQLTSIRAQMNPHFIFNTMSLIQGKVLNGLKDEANHQIQNLSFLLRKVLDFSGKEMIFLQEEIEMLEKYLAIENARFDGALDYTIHIDEVLKHEMIRIPSLLTQPFVENALRHGLMHKEGTKQLHIAFTLADELLTIHIRDFGVGRQASAEFNKGRRTDHKSFAMDAYRKRVDLLNKNSKQKIELNVIDHFNDHKFPSGTSVILTIPLNYEPAIHV